MKRNALWLKLFVVCVGAFLPILMTLVSNDTRTIISKYLEYNSVIDPEIRSMNPQNEGEFWRDLNHALELQGTHPGPFVMSDADIIRHLTHEHKWIGSSSGAAMTELGLKPWFREELLRQATFNLQYYYAYGPGVHYYSQYWNRDVEKAYEVWRFQPYIFWGKIIGSLGLGGGFIWIGLLFLPYLIILILSTLVVSGKVVPPEPVVPNQVVVHASTSSGDANHHHPGVHDVAVSSPRIGWLIVWAMRFAVVIRDRQWITRGIRAMKTRAPPFRKESVMRGLVLSLVVLLAGSTVTQPVSADATSLHFSMGEQPNAKGMAALLIADRGNFTAVPVFFYDGVTGFEAFGTYTVKDSAGLVELQLAPGLGLGGINGLAGITPYGAAHLGYAVKHLPYSLSGSFSARHSLAERFNHLFVANLAREWDRSALGLAYQPILTTGWQQRLAVNGWHKFGRVKVIGEVRMSLDERHRTSMSIDVDVPLK